MNADTYVLVDTNLLPTSGNLQGAFWQSLRQLCKLKNIRLALVEVVLNENVNRKVELARGWSQSLSDAQRGLANYIYFSTYIPSPEAVGEAWKKSLIETFEILPVHGDDAVEALRREALRVRPAQGGKGARDSAIWLTAVRLAGDGHNVVLLSANTDDFGRQGLHGDLASELHDVPGSLQYLVNLQHFVDSIAEKKAAWDIDLTAFGELFASHAREQLASFFEVLDLDSISDEDLENGVIEFPECNIKSAFLVEGRGVARLSGYLTLSRPSGPAFVSATFDTWVDFDESTLVLAPNYFDELDINFR
jgi:hypothetical protein